MRILVFSEFFRPYVGGIEVLADQLLPALIAKGHEIQVITSHGPMPLPDEESFGPLLVRRFPIRKVLEGRDPEGMLLLRQRFGRLLRELDPDVIHLNGMAPGHLLVLPLLSNASAAVLVQLHQRLFDWEVTRDSLVMRLVSRADWLVSVSDSALKQARSVAPEIETRSSVIRNAVHTPDLVPSPLSFTPPTFLCLGRLAAQKGFDLALRALAMVADRFPDLRLVIAGDGDERPSLEALAVSLGIADRCEWRGWIRPGDVFSVIDEATAMIMPSHYEGLPLVAVEAAWMARPVVGTRIDGIVEIVCHEETGLLVEPGNVDELAAAMVRLLERPEETRRMGAAARELVQREFGWEQCVAAYDALYRQLGELSATRRGAA